MKNLITEQEVEERAGSPESALEVSIDVWRQRCEMNEKEMKSVCTGSNLCGLCQYYGVSRLCDKNDKGNCPLNEPGESECCSEWYETSKAITAWRISEVSFAALKSAFYAMLDRLEREKAKLPKESKKEAKPEIRHTEYGFTEEGCPRIYLRDISGKEYYANTLEAGEGVFSKASAAKADEIDLRIGNLFDELEGMDAEMTKYKSLGIELSISKSCSNVMVSTHGYSVNSAWTSPEARRFARAILVLCANAERGK